MTTPSERIIDNSNNFSTGGLSAISGNGAFCLPMGTDRLIFGRCDKLDWLDNQFLVATENPAVSATWDVTPPIVQPTNSGYEFWIYDPNGTYSYRRFRSHATSDGSGSGATRACYMKVNGWANSVTTPLIPASVLMNVRVRGRIGRINLEFGPACQFKLDPARAACPLIKLQDNPAESTFSCGVTRNWGGGNSTANRLTATPPQFIPAVSSSLIRYQFRFRNPSEGVCIVRPVQTTYNIQLNWSAASGPPLLCGRQYLVDVRVSKDGGVTWCVDQPVPSCTNPVYWGPVCTVNITPCVSGLAQQTQGTNADAAIAMDRIAMYPNPNRGDQLQLVWGSIPTDVAKVELDIYDLQGKRVEQHTIAVEQGMTGSPIDLRGSLSTGMYLVHVKVGDRFYSERLIIQE